MLCLFLRGGGKVTVASVKSLFGVEWGKLPLVDAFSHKGLLLGGNSPIVMCHCNFVRSHSWNRKFGNNARSLDGNQITWFVLVWSSFGVLFGVVLVDLILFANKNLFPINWSFNGHEHVSTKDKLSWGESKCSVIGTLNGISSSSKEILK